MAAYTDMPGWRDVRWLIAANAAVFLIIWAGRLTGTDLAEWLAVPASPALLLRCPWTVLTYMVTQVEFLHLFFNMLWLWCFAVIAYRIWPGIRFATLYLAGGLGGAAAYIILHLLAGGTGSLCGSSAAVLGIMSYTAVMAGNTRVQLMLFGSVRLRTIVIIAAAIALIGAGGNIGSLTAHAGGFAAGIVWALKAKAPAKKKSFRRLRGDRVADALRRHHEDHAELDALLDKIRVSGFDSLTNQERKRLETLSNRLDPQ